MDDELEHALAVLSDKEGRSRQELIRRAILERYERSEHREKVDQATESANERWKDVLDQLETA